MGIVANDRPAGGGAFRSDNPVIAPLPWGRPWVFRKSAIHETKEISGRVDDGPGDRGRFLRVDREKRFQFGRLVFESFADGGESQASQ